MTKPVVRTFVDNATDDGFQQDSGVVAATAVGDFYAIWRDTGNFNSGHADIVGRHFDTLGNPIGGDVSLLPLNNAFGVPFNASQPATVALPIAGQASGTATAFSDNFNSGPDFDVYVVRTNASLSRLENPILIDGSTSVADDPSVTSFADGSLVVSYTIENSATDWVILARTVSPSGVVGPVITLFNDTDRSDLSDLATLKNGNFVGVFESPFLGSPTDLDSFFTIKTESGANVVSPTTVVGAGSTATETDPHVAALAGGGFVVTWTDSAGDESGTSQGIRATVYDASGGVVPNAGDILVNQFNQAGTQGSNDVTALPDGGFEVAWEDIAAGVDRVQRFDAAGHLIGTPVTISNLATFNLNAATLTNDRSVYTFNDFSSGNNNTDSSILRNPQPEDFSGDGLSDILWRNANGDTALWLSNSSGFFSFQDLAVVGGDWQIAGSGDFNQVGEAGILWRNANGDTALWGATGSGGFAFQDLGVVPTSWQIAGTGDFAGSGTDGILWRNSNGDTALWNPNGSGAFAFQDLGVVPTSWQIAGNGDFTGTGKDSILWRNSNGDTALWNPNGSGAFTFQDLGVVGNDWQIAGNGDFTGTGKDSILWRNANGDTALWNPNGSGAFTFQDLGVVPTSWQIAGAGDFDGSGKDGILWRNSNGDTALWDPNSSGAFTFKDLGVVSGDWSVHKIFA